MRTAIRIAAANIADKTLAEVISGRSDVSILFSDLAKGATWDDYAEYHFRCLHCHEEFWLHAETYHGSGGCWEPKDAALLRDNSAN